MMVTLPQPSGAFRWAQLGSNPALVCARLEPFARHFFTTRSWRLGTGSRSEPDGWSQVAEAAGVDDERLVRLTQVHGADVVIYLTGAAPPQGAKPCADVVLSDDPSLALTVQTADCLPILIVDSRTGAVAAAHAGWRGLAASVPRVVVDRFVSALHGDRRDLLVAIGPAIGACCYEVGEDVRARFAREGFRPDQVDRWFRPRPAISASNPPMPSLSAERRPNHWFFDPSKCAREQLQDCGIEDGQIFCADSCTASHAQFCSYRRDGTGAGRLAAVIRPVQSEL